MDPDEFMARMIAAGVPDMQMVPTPGSQAHSEPTKSHAFTDASYPQPAADPPGVQPQDVFQMPSLKDSFRDELLVAGMDLPGSQPPTGAGLPTAAVSLPGEPPAVLPTHSAAVAGNQAVVPDVGTGLLGAAPLQQMAPAVPAAGMSTLACTSAFEDQDLAVMQSQNHVGSGGGGSRFPTVEELERAGVTLVLEAEANGRLKQQHKFLYAAAGDLTITDVKELLSCYKVRQLILIVRCAPPFSRQLKLRLGCHMVMNLRGKFVLQEVILRYEALSLAAAQLASQAAAISVVQAPPELVASDIPTRTSGSHLIATRYDPQPAALETAPTPCTALALEEASLTAQDTAERVLKPTTSAGLYDDSEQPDEDHPVSSPHPAASRSDPSITSVSGLPAPASSAGGADEASATDDFAQAMSLQNDDRFLSLAKGEAQADAQDMDPSKEAAVHGEGHAHAEEQQAPDAAHPAGALPTARDDRALGLMERSLSSGYKADSEGLSVHAASTAAGDLSAAVNGGVPPATADGQVAGAAAGDCGEDGLTESTQRRKSAADLDARASISSTAATVGDMNSLEISRLQDVESRHAESNTHASTHSTTEDDDAKGSVENGAASGVREAAEAAPAYGPEKGVPATSNDVDPFYETDLALKMSPSVVRHIYTLGPCCP
jgi:hypothetical protein